MTNWRIIFCIQICFPNRLIVKILTSSALCSWMCKMYVYIIIYNSYKVPLGLRLLSEKGKKDHHLFLKISFCHFSPICFGIMVTRTHCARHNKPHYYNRSLITSTNKTNKIWHLVRTRSRNKLSHLGFIIILWNLGFFSINKMYKYSIVNALLPIPIYIFITYCVLIMYH